MEYSGFQQELAGMTVLVTRPRSLHETPLVDRLHASGADVILHPVIEISEPDDWKPVDEAISRLAEYGTAVFLSGNGVDYFFARFREFAGPDGFQGVRIAAMGPATASRIQAYGERVDFVPDTFNSQAMADLLVNQEVPEPILLLRANRGSDVLRNRLASAGKAFEEVVTYSSRDVATPNQETSELLAEGRVDWVTLTSSAIARSTISLYGEALSNTKLASISPTTSAVIREFGFQPSVEASQFNFDGLVDAMVGYR